MNKNKYSTEIATAIATFLTEDNWKFNFDEQKGIIKLGVGLKSKLKKADYLVIIHQEDYTVYAISPIGADEEDNVMMAAMAEFICRANYGMKSGNFEMDWEDGEIRFKVFVHSDDTIPTQEIIRRSLYCPAVMLDRYGDGILGIIFGNLSAEDAIDKCEGKKNDRIHSLLAQLIEEDESADADVIMTRLATRLGLNGNEDDDSESLEANDEDSKSSAVFITEGEEYPVDSMLITAAEYAVSMEKISVTDLQRHMHLGYARAARLMEGLEHYNIVNHSHNGRKREVIMTVSELSEWEDMHPICKNGGNA